MSTPEQQVRDMLERMGFENAQSLTAGDVVELANIIAENARLKQQMENALALVYAQDRKHTPQCAVANVCDEILDRSGALLGRIRDKAAQQREVK